MPPTPSNSQVYQQSLIDARAAWAQKSGLTQAQVKGAYQQAATSLGSRVAAAPPTAPSTAWNLGQFQTVIQDYASTLDQRVLDAMHSGIYASYHDSADSVLKTKAADAYGSVFGPEAIDAHVRGINQRAAASYITRTGTDGIKLSDRVWKANQQWRQATQSVVQNAVIAGQPPVQVARQIEQYLQPGVNVPYKAETAKRLRVPKDTSMPAMRVARTEMQNSFHEGTISSHSSMPSYLGIRWHISPGPGHVTDVCDTYAAQGFFPKGTEPLKPHPQCFCTAVPVHRDSEDVLNDLDEWLANPSSHPDLEAYYNDIKPLLDVEVASVAGAAGGPLLGGYAKGDKVLIDVKGTQVIATIHGEHASKGVLTMFIDPGQGMQSIKVWRAPSKIKLYTGPPPSNIPLQPGPPPPAIQTGINVGTTIHAIDGLHKGKVGIVLGINDMGGTYHIKWTDGSENSVVHQNVEKAPLPASLLPGDTVKVNWPEEPSVHGQVATISKVNDDGSYTVALPGGFGFDMPHAASFKLELQAAPPPVIHPPPKVNDAYEVTDPNSPYFGQIGNVDYISHTGKLDLFMPDHQVVTFEPHQFQPAAPGAVTPLQQLQQPVAAPPPAIIGYLDAPGSVHHGKQVIAQPDPGTVIFADGSYGHSLDAWKVVAHDPHAAPPPPPPAPIPPPAAPQVITPPPGVTVDVTVKGTKVVTDYQGQRDVTGTVTSWNAGKNVVVIKPDVPIVGAKKATFTKNPKYVKALVPPGSPPPPQQTQTPPPPPGINHLKAGDTVIVNMPGNLVHGEEAILGADLAGKAPNDSVQITFATGPLQGTKLPYYLSDLVAPSTPISTTPPPGSNAVSPTAPPPVAPPPPVAAPIVTAPPAPLQPTVATPPGQPQPPQMPTSLPTGPPPPDVSTFTVKPNQSVGGGHAKTIYNAPDQSTWMFKPDVNAALAEKAGYNVQSLLGLPTPEMHVMTVGGQVGSMQQFHQGVKGEVSLTGLRGLTIQQRADIQTHQVVDWLISQHDSNDGAMLIGADNHVLAVDKGQAFKFLGQDRLHWTYKPNPNALVYQPLFEGYIGGRFFLQRSAIEPILARIEALDDNVFKEAVKPYAELAASNGWVSSPEVIYDQLLKRKHTIRDDFDAMYDQADQLAGRSSGPSLKLKKPPVAPPVVTATSTATANQVTPIAQPLADAVGRAGTHGKSVLVGGQDIENGAVHVFQMKVSGDGTRLVISAKVRAEAEKKLLAHLDGLPPPGTHTYAPTYVAPPPMDPAWTTTLKTLKHFNFHMKAGADQTISTVNTAEAIALAGQIAAGQQGWTAQKSQYYADLLTKVTGTTSITELAAMTPAALKVKVESLWANNTTLLSTQFAEYVAPAAPTPATAAAPVVPPAPVGKFTAREAAPSYPSRRLVNGDLVTDNTRTSDKKDGIVGHHEWFIDDMGPGVSAQYMPHFGHATISQNQSINPYARHGRLDITIDNWQGGSAEIEQGVAKLRELGLDANPATPQDVELLYLVHQVHAMKLEADNSYTSMRAGINDSTPISEQIKLHQDYLSQRLGKDITKMPNYKPVALFHNGYRVAGANGHDTVPDVGKPYFERIDITRADLNREMKNYVLTHDSRMGTEEFLAAMLDGNGALSNTEERVRQALFDPRQGISSVDDMYSGGASYFFTRLARGNTSEGQRGPFWFSKELLLQTDLLAYDHDSWGQSDPNTKRGRHTDMAAWKTSQRGGGSNEVVFKNGFPLLDYIERIAAPTSTARLRMIKMLKDRGIDSIRGKPVEDIVQVGYPR